jgi:hypothetical protein
MPVEASVGALVQLQFPVYDIDGISPWSGLVDSDFESILLVDDAESAEVASVSEVGSTSKYVVEFTPDVAGLWYVEVTTPIDDVYACYVHVGPPTSDTIEAITQAVWSELLPVAFPIGSAGERLASADDRTEVLENALIAARLTVGAGASATLVPTDATQADGFYNGMTVMVRSVSGNVVRRIQLFANASGEFTLPELPFVPSPGDDFIVLGILGEVALASDSTAAVKLCEIHKILGLDPESPLTVSKRFQQAGTIYLKQTEVGTKIVVERTS